MSVTLGRNIASLKAQQRLNETTSSLGRVFERLSSGQRINRASDDAAGLSVTMTLGNKSRVLGRAAQNLGDATSLLSIADSTLGEVSSVLTRLVELAQQAANGSYSQAQRANLNTEFQALQTEIRRIAQSTTFNGLGLLAGGAPEGTIRQRTEFDPYTEALAISSDGRFQVFNTLSNGIQIVDSDTGEIRSITGAAAIDTNTVRVSDSGDIFYRSTTRGDIYRYNYNTRTNDRVVAGAVFGGTESGAFNVSQDGSTLVFASSWSTYTDGGSAQTFTTNGSAATTRAYAVSLATGNIRLLTTSTDPINHAVVSADGSFAAVGYEEGGGAGIVTADLRGSNPRLRSVTGISNPDALIGISTSGRVVFGEKNDLGGLNPGSAYSIYSFDAITGGLERLTTRDLGQVVGGAGTALSANGRLVSFAIAGDPLGANSQGFSQIFQLDIETRALTQRTYFTQSDALGALVAAPGFQIAADGSRFVGQSISDDLFYELDLRNSASSFNFEAGFGASGSVTASISALLTSVRGMDTNIVSSAAGARNSIYRINQNIEALAASRGVVGAAMARVGIASNLAGAQRDQAIAARGRVLDADTADESARLIRFQVAQQAASAVLAQANQQPAVVLQLLQ